MYPPFSTLVFFFLSSLPLASWVKLPSAIVSLSEPSCIGQRIFYISSKVSATSGFQQLLMFSIISSIHMHPSPSDFSLNSVNNSSMSTLSVIGSFLSMSPSWGFLKKPLFLTSSFTILLDGYPYATNSLQIMSFLIVLSSALKNTALLIWRNPMSERIFWDYGVVPWLYPLILKTNKREYSFTLFFGSVAEL